MGGPAEYPVAAADYYEIFGVDRNAPREAIRYVYRKLVSLYHPDLEESDAEAFKTIADAYEVLSCPTKRAEYDAYLSRLSARNSFTLSVPTENWAPGVYVIIS